MSGKSALTSAAEMNIRTWMELYNFDLYYRSNCSWASSLAMFKWANRRPRRVARDNTVLTFINILRARGYGGLLFVILNSNLIGCFHIATGSSSPLNYQPIRFVVVTWQVLNCLVPIVLVSNWLPSVSCALDMHLARCYAICSSLLPSLPPRGSHSDNLILVSNLYT